MSLRSRLFSASTLVILAFSTLSAHATSITYDLVNVTLTLGVGGAADGTLTGSFTVTNGTTLSAVDIVASHTGGFPGETYILNETGLTTDVSIVALSLPTVFRVDTPGDADQLELVFSSLNASGGTLTGSSYEAENGSGNREVATGTVVAESTSPVPEPSSLALLGTGILGLAGVARRRFLTV